jgi:hypothetical protein
MAANRRPRKVKSTWPLTPKDITRWHFKHGKEEEEHDGIEWGLSQVMDIFRHLEYITECVCPAQHLAKSQTAVDPNNQGDLWFTEDHSALTDAEGKSWYSKLSKVAVTLVIEVIHVRLGYQGVAADHDPEEACRQLLLRVQNPEWTDGKFHEFPVYECNDLGVWMHTLPPDQASPTAAFKSRFRAIDAGVVSDRTEVYVPTIDLATRDAEELEDNYIAGLHDDGVDTKIYEGLGIENPRTMGMAPVDLALHSDFIELFAGASQLGRVKLHLQDLLLQQRRLGKIIVSCKARLERIQRDSWELRNALKSYQQYREKFFEVMESIEGDSENLQRLRSQERGIHADSEYSEYLKETQGDRGHHNCLRW